MVNNELNKLIEDYLKSDRSTKGHKTKINDYISEFNPQSIDELFDKENMELFIFARGTNASNIRSALVSLFEFFRKIGKVDKLRMFPVTTDQLLDQGLNADESNSDIFFIPRKYNIIDFYREDLEVYEDIENKLMARAYIALCLGVGYKSSDVEKMVVEDFDYERGVVKNPYKIRNTNSKSNNINNWIVDEIKLASPALECINEFWDYFWSSKDFSKVKNEKFIFFKNTAKQMYIIRNALEEISVKMCLDSKTKPSDLRCNMFLHSLYNSNGSSLIDINRLLGQMDRKTINAVLDEYYNNTGLDMIESYEPVNKYNDSEKQEPDLQSTVRKEMTVTRTVRDSELAQLLKSEYQNVCQLCGETIKINNYKFYSEVHHIKPVGTPHVGPDVTQNMVVLCPNHHAMFDLGAIAIHPETNIIYKIDNETYMLDDSVRLRINEKRHKLDSKYLKYHWNNIFLPNIYPIRGIG